MSQLHLSVRRIVAAAALSLGILLITEWPTAQEGAQGKPRPDAVAAAGRGASGPKNVIEGTDEDDRLTGTDNEDFAGAIHSTQLHVSECAGGPPEFALVE